MKIAQVAPLFESVPPKYYGGTERVVSYLTEELVNQGHEVTLFASGDSVTQANLIAPCSRSLRLDKHCVDQMVHHVLMIEQVFKEAEQFDIVNDLSGFTPPSPEAAKPIKRAQAELKEMGVDRVVRVVDEETSQVVVNAFERRSKDVGYSGETADSVGAAGRLLEEEHVECYAAVWAANDSQ
jgi:glycosyltransferase involved in cell wall biosynthesis